MEMFGGFQPDWLAVKDMRALAGYYGGNSTLYSAVALRAWMIPVACWSACILAMCLVMMCLSILVRRQWVERERLTYPIVELPLQMTAPGGALWRNRLFWMGFALAAGIDLLNGLHYIWPNIPEIIVKHQDMKPFIVNKPWNAVDWFPISYYPFAIGLGYLLPVDLLFSCWFFYLFWKGRWYGERTGWDATPVPVHPRAGLRRLSGHHPFLHGMAVATLPASFGAPSVETEPGDSGEGISDRVPADHRTRLVFLVWFFVGGMSLARASGLVPLPCPLPSPASVPVGRLCDVHFSGQHPQSGIGFANLSGRDRRRARWFWWFNRAYRNHPIRWRPQGGTTRRKRRWSPYARGGAARYLTAFWSFLDCAYRYGTGANSIRVGFGWRTTMACATLHRAFRPM